MTNPLAAGVVVLWACAGAQAQTEFIAFDQQPSTTTADGYFADGAPFQFYSQRIAAAFTPNQSCLIKGITFWGSGENFSAPGIDNVMRFYVGFMEDAAGSPGDVLGEQLPFVNEFTITPTGRTNALGGEEFKFHFDMGIRIPVTPGTTYWVTVGAVLDEPQEDAWGWTFTDTSSGQTASNPWQAPGWQPASGAHGVAFELVGIPAPGALALGIVCLGGAARRRR